MPEADSPSNLHLAKSKTKQNRGVAETSNPQLQLPGRKGQKRQADYHHYRTNRRQQMACALPRRKQPRPPEEPTSGNNTYWARQPPCRTHIRDRAQFMLLLAETGGMKLGSISVVAAVVRDSQSVTHWRFHHLQFLAKATILGLLRFQLPLQLINLSLQSCDGFLRSVPNRLKLGSQSGGSRSFRVPLLNSLPIAIFQVYYLHLQRSGVAVDKRRGLPRLCCTLAPLVRQASHRSQAYLKPASSAIAFQPWRYIPRACPLPRELHPRIRLCSWWCWIHQVLPQGFLQLVRTVGVGPHASRSTHIHPHGRRIGRSIRRRILPLQLIPLVHRINATILGRLSLHQKHSQGVHKITHKTVKSTHKSALATQIEHLEALGTALRRGTQCDWAASVGAKCQSFDHSSVPELAKVNLHKINVLPSRQMYCRAAQRSWSQIGAGTLCHGSTCRIRHLHGYTLDRGAATGLPIDRDRRQPLARLGGKTERLLASCSGPTKWPHCQSSLVWNLAAPLGSCTPSATPRHDVEKSALKRMPSNYRT
mmetsp:Transcript_31531/g.69014  ORF Transcript_31531/g.69014 Transcript_31531/m.69014 type:complete len:535 (-) Transcript_31531:8-1612(-)